MPDCNDPHYVALDSVEKPVWYDDHLPVWKIWKFRYNSSRVREFFEPSQYRLSTLTELDCRMRIILADVAESGEELSSG